MVLGNALNATTAGLQSLTSAGVWNGRTLTGTANQVSVSNGDGVSGNPTISLTSTIYTNISFDSGSNTLSAYSTGTFTPAISNSGSAPTVSYSAQTGRYTIIGNRIIGVINITVTSYAAGTGDSQISSLPFSSNSTTNNNSTNSASLQNTTFGVLVLYYTFTIDPNVTVGYFPGVRSANTALNLDASGFLSTSVIRCEFTYEL